MSSPRKPHNRFGRRLTSAFLRTVAFLLIAAAYPLSAHAINYYTGGRLADGFYLNLYPYWYTADTRTDGNGKAVTNNLGLEKYGVFIGGSYYSGDLLLNILVPVGSIEVASARDKDAGLGDVQLRAGYFLPIREVTILPLLAVKVPSGGFDKQKAVNLGDGQTDIMAEVYFNKFFGRISIDWLLKYSIRLRNPDSDRTPGNEFATEGLVTCKLSDDFRLGPSAAFVIGDDLKKGGRTVADSGVLKLAVGGELVYRGLQRVKLVTAVLKDVYTENSPEGVLVMGRIHIPF